MALSGSGLVSLTTLELEAFPAFPMEWEEEVKFARDKKKTAN